MPDLRRAAFFGGIYGNPDALLESIRDARDRGAEALYCLGDLGGFGPHPELPLPHVQFGVSLHDPQAFALFKPRAPAPV